MIESPKVYAIYLPQFHETEDNNNWWGKGFTEWTAVKGAERYFDGHRQPRVPINSNYYDLLQKETMLRQAKLAKEYGIDGFLIYHYFFADGKKEIEKPAENLLKWKDIDLQYCFSWANQSWIRSWSKIKGNVWGEQQDKQVGKSDTGILVMQNYGTEELWREHFEYLLPFFKDERYIKHEGCPVFFFFKPEDIGCLKEMTDLWREMAKRNGLPGLYLIGADQTSRLDGLDAAMHNEPSVSMDTMQEKGKIKIINGVRCFDYEGYCREAVERKPLYGCKTYECATVGFDTTPRRGKNGECFIGETPKQFENYLTDIIAKSIGRGNDFVLINAWNEWGEGMYLEPDEENKYAYLEAVKKAKESIEKGNYEVAETKDEKDLLIEELSYTKDMMQKYQSFYKILSLWLSAEIAHGNVFKDYLKEHAYKTVAIYGFADMGKRLYEQLKKDGVDVSFAIDRYVGELGDELKVYRPEESFPEVDLIIVTAYDSKGIIRFLGEKTKAETISLGELCERIYE